MVFCPYKNPLNSAEYSDSNELENFAYKTFALNNVGFLGTLFSDAPILDSLVFVSALVKYTKKDPHKMTKPYINSFFSAQTGYSNLPATKKNS